MEVANVERESKGLSRRQLLERAAALGIAAGAGGAFAPLSRAGLTAVTAAPKRGGTLRVGGAGGAPSVDTLEPSAEGGAEALSLAYRFNVFSRLGDNDPLGSGTFKLQLAESMEPNAKADVWLVKLKQGVVWHDGSPFSADDVIYSLHRMLDPKSKLDTAAKSISMVDPKGIKKINDHTIQIRLTQPWYDLPGALGQRWINVVKNGARAPWTQANAIGTGPFKLKEWRPGTKYTYVRNPDYFESGRPYLDGIEHIALTDPVARLNALVSGQVDAISDLSPTQVAVLKKAGLNVLISKGGGFSPICMNTMAAPFNDVRVRQAMKLLVDRKLVLSSTLQGYGVIGNDLFGLGDPMYASDLTQRQYDPDRARSLLKAAGQLDTVFPLYTSSVISDFVPAALSFQASAKKAGVNIKVVRAPADTYWDNTFGKHSFDQDTWGYRPLLAQWVQSFVVWDKVETNWKTPSGRKAKALFVKVAATIDPAKRKALAHEAQKLLWDDGGQIIPYHKSYIDGYRKNVHGVVSSPFGGLNSLHFRDFWMD
jgi:peptide/nickel transport system substrate-binding protein